MTLYLSAFFEDKTLIVKNVTSLENASKIARKFIVKQLHDKSIKNEVIDIEAVRKYLDKEIFEYIYFK